MHQNTQANAEINIGTNTDLDTTSTNLTLLTGTVCSSNVKAQENFDSFGVQIGSLKDQLKTLVADKGKDYVCYNPCG